MTQGPSGSQFTWFTWILFACIAFISAMLVFLVVNRPAHGEELPGGATTEWRSGPGTWRGAPEYTPQPQPCLWNCPGEREAARPQPFIFIQPGSASPQVGLIGPGGIAATLPPVTPYGRPQVRTR